MLNAIPLETVISRDNKIKVDAPRQFTIYRGGQQITFKDFSTTSSSNTSTTFSCPPPNPGIIIRRVVKISMPVTIQFNGTGPGVAGDLLQPDLDGFRQFPLASCMTAVKLTINNSTTTVTPNDIIHAFSQYNTCHTLQERPLSTAPSMGDMSQNYYDLFGSTKNPLASYSSGFSSITRGGFPITAFTNTHTSASVSAVITEPLFIPPLTYGYPDACPGLVGVQTFDLEITWGDLSRIWSHADPPNTSPATVAAVFAAQPNGVVVTLGIPTLNFEYITPTEVQNIPASVSYSFYNIKRYITSDNQALAPFASRTLVANNFQLSSIPRRLLIYVKRRTIDEDYTTTDTFMQINNINLLWNNSNGLLSSASLQDLYDVAVGNGCNVSFEQWSGGPAYNLSFVVPPIGFDSPTPQFYGTIGSVLALTPGKDIGLGSLQAPGLLQNFQIQIQVTVKNMNHRESIIPSLYIIVVEDGTFTIQNLSGIQQVGVITPQEILNLSASPDAEVVELDQMMGGNFWTGLKDFGEGFVKGVERVLPVIEKGVEIGSKVAPLVAPLLLAAGDKKGRKKGGCRDMYGGRRLTMNQLAKRLEY